eukprot:m.85865 g.85865  ORF g.85865 m.85865 type:complete len:690 (+) comp50892_c0_seq1:321-2390(+)
MMFSPGRMFCGSGLGDSAGTMLLASCILALLCSAALGKEKLMASDYPTKQLSGPPSEFAENKLPPPINAALHARSASYHIDMTENESGGYSWTQTIYVDSSTGFTMSLFSIVDGTVVTLVDPNGQQVDLSAAATNVTFPDGDNDDQYPGVEYIFENPVVGAYQLTTTASSLETTVQTSSTNEGYVVIWNDSTDQIFTRFATYDFQQNDTVGLLTFAFDATSYTNGDIPSALQDVVLSAQLVAVFPDGNSVNEAMHDDGLHGDGASGDGIYGASFTASMIGIYTVQAVVAGTHSGVQFVRTTQHVANVIPRDLELDSIAWAKVDNTSNRLDIFLGVDAGANSTTNYRPYFELWGNSMFLDEIPVCWASGIVNLESENGVDYLKLSIDLQWLTRVGAVEPFSIRNVFVQDIDELISLTEDSLILLSMTDDDLALIEQIKAQHVAQGYKGEITQVMREGIPKGPKPGCSGSAVMMSHGVCASKNPWSLRADDFTDAVYFLDAEVGRSNNQFALKLLDFATTLNLCSFGLIAHSQGGLASLHLLNYYSSGLDSAVGERKLQSVASPFRGSTAMGSSANLAKLFGSPCEQVYDLTRDGAEAWLAGISQTSKDATNFYTCQMKPGGLFGKGWCNQLSNTVMEYPNDGATENIYTNPGGGNNHGNVEGQCHIEGMKWPAVFLDSSRNVILNQFAAR